MQEIVKSTRFPIPYVNRSPVYHTEVKSKFPVWKSKKFGTVLFGMLFYNQIEDDIICFKIFIKLKNHLEILDEIIESLNKNGLIVEKQELENEIEASATGSEICLRSGSKLLNLQKMNKNISSSVGHLIRDFISYCHKNGLYPKSI